MERKQVDGCMPTRQALARELVSLANLASLPNTLWHLVIGVLGITNRVE